MIRSQQYERLKRITWTLDEGDIKRAIRAFIMADPLSFGGKSKFSSDDIQIELEERTDKYDHVSYHATAIVEMEKVVEPAPTPPREGGHG